MRGSDHRGRTFAIFCAILAASIAFHASAADPVSIAVTITGAAKPGATVNAKAAVTVNDGSTIQSYSWRQTSGITVTLANATSDNLSITFPAAATYRAELVKVLKAPPIPDNQLPGNIPPQGDDYAGGIQDRWGVAGIMPTALAKAGATGLEVTVVTSSGTYKKTATATATLPWPNSTGLRNVPLSRAVLLQGKAQDTYNWAFTNKPGASAATLVDATSRYPEFTPDIPGTYEVSVTDTKANKTVTLSVHAGTWKGMIAGINSANGEPVPDPTCMGCHVKNTPHFDLFTPWAKTGHAYIFSDNVINTAPDAHYTASCLSCHVVGYDTTVNNGGFDDAPSYQAFVDSGMLTHGDPLNWSKIVTQYPDVAKLANIQCENCHGPQESAAHMKKDGSRKTLSSDLCATCHGRAPRHGRFQQWQLSGHANYTLAVEEGTSGSCSKCHSAQGFIAWQNTNFQTADLTVTWTTDDVHPQTCVTCHDPHNIGTASKEGEQETNAMMRVNGTTPMLMSGFKAEDVGNGAICMTCHNGRRGLKNDTNFTLSDATRAPHAGPQADILMGQNLYFVKTGVRSYHSMIEGTCVTCHMEKTEAPSQIYSEDVGTNHTFFASEEICAQCHKDITPESAMAPVEAKMEALKAEIETAIKYAMQAQIRLGNFIDIGTSPNVTRIRSAADISDVEFIESHGRQGVTVRLANGTTLADNSLQAVKVVRPTGSSVELYAVSDPNIGKAGWNYFMIHSDKSAGVHNPAFVNSALDVATYALKSSNATAAAGGVPPGTAPAGVGGGLGNGAGAVSCTTPYVYWTEIAGHMPGNAGSQWRTDVVTRNLGTETANLRFILHQPGGNLEGTSTVTGSSQKGFEDVVATLGGNNNLGSLEICSSQPLLVMGRIFNQGEGGTYGQNVEGHVADLGYSAGQTVSLIGLRQKTDVFRSNLIVTNAGTTEAQVSITLFDAAGTSLTTYTITVPAGQVINDGEPFRNRANKPDLDWGFATVTVLKGTNVRTMASLIDMKTNDPTTIPPKQ